MFLVESEEEKIIKSDSKIYIAYSMSKFKIKIDLFRSKNSSFESGERFDRTPVAI